METLILKIGFLAFRQGQVKHLDLHDAMAEICLKALGDGLWAWGIRVVRVPRSFLATAGFSAYFYCVVLLVCIQHGDEDRVADCSCSAFDLNAKTLALNPKL